MPASPRRFLFVLVMVALFALGVIASMGKPPAQGVSAGSYKGAISAGGGATRVFNIRLAPSNNPNQLTVKGNAHVADQSEADCDFSGTYYVSSNKLAASGRIRGRAEDTIKLDGLWDQSTNQFLVKVTVEGKELREVLKLRKLGEDTEPDVDVEIRPVATRAGTVIAGVAIIKLRNVPEMTMEVYGSLSSLRAGDFRRTDGGARLKIPVKGTQEVTVYLADLAITAPEASEDDRIEVVALLGYHFFASTQRIQITSGDPTPLTIRNLKTSAGTSGGLTGSFVLDYRVQNGRSAKTDFSITEKVSVTPAAGGAKKDLAPVTWSGSAPSLQSTAKNGEVGQHAFTVEKAGEYYLDYEISGLELSPVSGRTKVTIGSVGGSSTGTPSRVDPGQLTGSVSVDRSQVKAGEPVMVTVKTNMSGRGEAEAEEVVELLDPKGNVIQTSRKKRMLSSKSPKVTQFQIDAFGPGAYKVKARVGGAETDTWSGETTFTVEEKKGTGPTGQTNPPAGEQGTYGLVKKDVGRAASPEQGPYGAISGSITETSVQVTWTAIRDYEGTFTYQANLSTPPAILKPGEIYELTVNATANRSSPNQPYHGAGTRYYVEGAETLENTSAFAGSASNGQFYSSNTGKLRFKVGTGGTIKIYSTFGSMLWGSDGIWSPCTYTYQWNAVPTVNPGTGGGEEEEKTGTTGMIQLTQDDVEENAVLQAWLDTEVINLRAGEPSSIVHVNIKGYRRRTEDRVEVIFPQKTDNWASLPGGIVVNGGDGHYWPPQMATPVHIDGYFFSARSTAQASTQVIDIIVRQRKAGEVRLKLTVNVIPKGGTGPAGPTVAPNWTGEWESNVDQLQFMQEKEDVFGFFFLDGETYVFEARMNGRTISFTYHSDKAVGGTGVLTMSEDGKSFTGKRVDDKTKKETEWKGTRK